MVHSTISRGYQVPGRRLSILSVTIIIVFSLLLASSGCISQPEISQTNQSAIPASTPPQKINETLKDQMYSILGINPISVVYQNDVLYVEYTSSFSGDSPQDIVDEMQKVCSFIVQDFAGETTPQQVTIQVIADRGKVTYTTRMNWNETKELGTIGMTYKKWQQFTEKKEV
jgi:hypothetical protein